MSRCFGFHRWRALKHGAGMMLDARDCLRCGRFEVWAYTRFYRAIRQTFEPLTEAKPETPA
jgi:hypothetical protein